MSNCRDSITGARTWRQRLGGYAGRVNLDANRSSISEVIDAGLLAGAVTLVWRAGEVLQVLRSMPEARRREVAEAARARVLGAHTGDHRAAELEGYFAEAAQACSGQRRAVPA